ncbi:PspA/IM30 family protein [Anoxybacterium hadale]|uniref:PspA/IM30 family protein n=1 Tax=Anoxybacterium hadale TaxID=3408580 RepID=A0ACD1AGP3_9FIRM|nr:PspA/IM30 family protein [Clostridiales bacterium]
MSLIKRVADLLDANINALIDKVEDPEVMLEKYLVDMNKEYKETEAMVANAIAARNITRSKYEEAQKQVDTWEKNAMLAVEKENDELAKKALHEQGNYERTRDGFKSELDSQAAEVENLKTLLSKLEDKINEAKSKKDLLITKAANAKTKKKLAEVSSKASGSDSTEGFARMEEKVNKMIAEADAFDELNGESLIAQFESFKEDNENTAIDDKLADLKAKMGK